MRVIKKVKFMVDSATPAVKVLAVLDSGAVAAGYTIESWTHTKDFEFDFYRKIVKS
jgi:hypothetical protein